MYTEVRQINGVEWKWSRITALSQKAGRVYFTENSFRKNSASSSTVYEIGVSETSFPLAKVDQIAVQESTNLGFMVSRSEYEKKGLVVNMFYTTEDHGILERGIQLNATSRGTASLGGVEVSLTKDGVLLAPDEMVARCDELFRSQAPEWRKINGNVYLSLAVGSAADASSLRQVLSALARKNGAALGGGGMLYPMDGR